MWNKISVFIFFLTGDSRCMSSICMHYASNPHLTKKRSQEKEMSDPQTVWVCTGVVWYYFWEYMKKYLLTLDGNQWQTKTEQNKTKLLKCSLVK